MTRQEIITEVKKFFKVKELVCDHTYSAFGETSWQFLDTEILHTLLVVRRDILKVPITVNDTVHHQRGLRCNICDLVQEKSKAGKIYLSAHCNGAGLDLIPQGVTAEEARNKIQVDHNLLPYPIRLEKDVTWVHIDCYDYMNGHKVNYFSA
jgi:hypothetical protein